MVRIHLNRLSDFPGPLHLINTKANLNSEVLRDICMVCCVPFDNFEKEIDFIDIFLLKRRNAIAHGEDTFIDAMEMDVLSARTIRLMRTFGDVLDNSVQFQSYKVS